MVLKLIDSSNGIGRNGRCRVMATCAICKKQFSLQRGDYKKKVAKNKGGRLYCSVKCYSEHMRTLGKGMKEKVKN